LNAWPIWCGNFAASERKYNPRFQGQKIPSVRAASNPREDKQVLDWSSYAEMRVIPTAATHHTIMRAPHVEQVAAILKQVLAGAPTGEEHGAGDIRESVSI
jgi:thioesterase domain-containing protein